MSAAAEQEKWIEEHMKRRKGERLDALRRGHGFGNRLFAEKIWWALVGHFNGLHPEYEVKDWRGRSYFVDFMWIVGAWRIVFEIMDFGSHGTDRSKYRSDLNRGLYLQSHDCIVFYISLDELKENPDFILAALRNALAPYLLAERGAAMSTKGTESKENRFSRIEKELMRSAVRRNRILRPSEAAKELGLHTMTVIKHCRMLVDKGKLRAVERGASRRVTFYEYIGALQSPDLV
ncbi:hypothetical protein [Cohnella sp. AR92]|uniref:hypothetical protein n=1 Tax=Cohnella sp. AR92 TaxID=648716 RepID=UPI000F8D18CA|nr:hypothetical protein [Cohnella sp. AR92]RUS47335.1 hypothetical protein ELR57_09405 [Cohnella sp. AR92]